LIALASVTALHAQAPAGKKAELTPLEQQVLVGTNEERKKEGLPPFQADAQLTEIARAHSQNMAKQEKMMHNLDGKTPFDRIKGTGYKYFFAGENIAAGDVPVDVIMNAWMKSEGHRKNIMHKEYTHIGIGAVRDAKDNVYYTQVFAKPRP